MTNSSLFSRKLCHCRAAEIHLPGHAQDKSLQMSRDQKPLAHQMSNILPSAMMDNFMMILEESEQCRLAECKAECGMEEFFQEKCWDENLVLVIIPLGQ